MVLQVKLIAFIQGNPYLQLSYKLLRIIFELYKLMQRLFRPNSTLLALFMFLPITPSIAIITAFTHSVLNDRTTEVTSISHHAKRVIDPTRN